MPEANQIGYSFKELATLMIRDRDIHEGYWGVFARFGITATNFGASEADIKPSAIVPIVELGLQKFEELNNLSVDAAKVNPPSSPSSSKRPAKGR
ncbi:MAG: hypothetical protein JWM21_206 [Acidobacteria bacterium]|nr:hypothetical protein [Acidobacteriota bacterium]